jgi:hypothetical protein
VAVNHARDGDRASHQDGDDRNQKRPQAQNGFEDSIHSPPPASARISGGADRDRTGGLLVANQALSQLSYSPNSAIGFWPLALSQTGIGLAKGQELTAKSDFWWAWIDLNYRPHPYQGCALAT